MKPKRKLPKNNNTVRSIVFGLLVIFLILVGIQVYGIDDSTEVPLSQVIEEANDGKLKKLVVKPTKIDIYRNEDPEDKPSQFAVRESRISLQEQGLEVGAVEIKHEEVKDWIGPLINLIVPLAIIIVLVIMFRSAQGQGSQALNFGRSKARLYGNEKPKSLVCRCRRQR